MTRDHAKQLLPIIEAYANGKTIQIIYDHIGAWQDSDTPDFSCFPTKYRIKPEAKKVMMTYDDFEKTARPTAWLKRHGVTEYMVIGWICYEEILIANFSTCEISKIKFKDILDMKSEFNRNTSYICLWSTDRTTWHTFEKDIVE